MTDPFPTDPREAAVRYLARGWMPIPLDGWRTKEVTRTGWPAERYAAADAHRFADNNIGLLLGEPSGGLVDVDLDCAEAVRCAAEYLPATGLVSGRAGAPRSHWWYACDPLPAKSLKFLDPAARPGEKATLVELRVGEGNAKMTVVPPSLHRDTGERIVWHRFDDPAAAPAADLEAAVRHVAAASLFARHWPDGVRHDSSLALAGGLLRAWGGDAERAERFVTAVCRAAAVDGGGLRKCQANVHDTAEKLRSGDKTVTGWPKLAKYVGDAVVTAVRAFLGIQDTPKAAVGGDPIPEELGRWRPPAPLPTMPPVPPFPVAAFPAKVADYWSAAAEALAATVDFIAVPALPLLGAAVGRSLAAAVKNGWHESPILWCPLVSPPGYTKSASLRKAAGPLPAIDLERAQQHAKDLKDYRTAVARYECELKEWKKDPTGTPPDEPVKPTFRQTLFDNFTTESLVRGNAANPRGIAICKDELSGLVASLNQYKSGKGDDKQTLLSMWAGAAVTKNRVGDEKAGLPPLMIGHTFLGVAGMMVPDTLAAFRGDVARGDFVNDGWADRMLPAFPDPVPMVAETWATVPDELEAGYAEVYRELLSWEMVPVLNDAGEPVHCRPYHVPFDRSAMTAWEDFTGEVARRANALDPFDSYRGVLSKSKQHTLRLSALVYALRRACGEVPEGATIDGETLRRAVVVMAYFEAHGRRCLGIGWQDRTTRVAQRLLKWLARNPAVTAFTLTDVFRQLKDDRDVKTSDRLAPVFRLLIDLGYLRPLTQTGFRPGPVPEAYSVNPTWDRAKPVGPEQTVSKPIADPERGPTVPTIKPESKQHRSNSGDCRTETESGEGNSERVYTETPAEEPPSSASTALSAEAEFPFGFNAKSEPPDDSQPDTPTAPEPEPEPSPDGGAAAAFVLVDGASDVTPVLEAVRASERVGFDTETTGLNPRTDRVRLIQLATARGVFVVDCRNSMPPALLAALSGVELVGHNLAFDLGFLTRYRFAPGKLFDAMLASQVLDAGDPKAKHGLAAVCQRHLGEEIDKDEQKSDWSGTLTQTQLQYAARDAELPLRLYPVLAAKLAEAKLTATADLENRALPCVAWMGGCGVRVDRRAWQLLALAAQGEARRLAGELDAMAPTPPGLFGSEPRNWNSPAQVKDAFAAVGVTLEATNDDALAAIDNPLAELLRRHRGATKLSGTYGDKWLRHVASDDRVYPGWHQAFTVTGRMSSSGPNMQQLPRDRRYRRCFVAPPGRVLVKADYSQIELRIAAVVAGDSTMIAAYERGDDLHALTAAAVLGKAVAEVTKGDRQLAKAVNFGLLFGGGAAMLVGYAKSSYGVTMTETQAQAYRAAFFARYPGLKRWHDAQSKAPVATRTRGGRRRKNVASFTEKLNSVVQGTAADGLKAALALLWERRHEHPTAFPVLAVHDEVVVECDEADAEAVKAWLTRAMADGMAPLCDPVPVEVEATIAPTWGG